MKILIDFLKFWNFSDISQEYSLSAAESVILTSPDRVLHYDETIEALVRILIDFLKALRFYQNQSILAVPQPESPRVRILSSFTPHTISASRWILAKLLRSQSTTISQAFTLAKLLRSQSTSRFRQVPTLAKTAPQSEHFAYDSCKPPNSCNMTLAFVPGGRFLEKDNQRDEFIKRMLTKLKKNNQRDEFIRRKMTKLNCFYDIEL